MAFILKTPGNNPKIYAGENAGWIEPTPEAPPAPEDQAQRFNSKEDAESFAKKYDIKADVAEVADKK